MGESNRLLSIRDYHLDYLQDRLTEDGIRALDKYIESGEMNAEGLANYLKQASPWFAKICEEQVRSFPINLAKTMVKTYCNIQRIQH